MEKSSTVEEEVVEENSTTPEVSPWKSSTLEKLGTQALHITRMQENKILQASFERFDMPFIGASNAILKVFDLIDRVSNTDSTVLILGESGTGKELVARALHNNSNRTRYPFVPVNCGAIPSELLESELFGHVKGAYTGAHQSRMGRFALANHGTLFLDEIGTMPPSLQVKILRALQEKEFEPVGGAKTQKSDCRVVAATNNDLEQEVAKGTFREDLYYRLNVIPITLPPLRDRREDIPLLLTHFIQMINEKKSSHIEGISEEAMSVLLRYNWPGNVRELENICQRLCILKLEGIIDSEDLPPKLHQSRPVGMQGSPWTSWLSDGIPEEGLDFDSLVTQFENDLILKALDKTGWNKNQAAQLLKLNRTTLVEKIKKRGLQQNS